MFHYTGAESLLSILERRQLWVSDIEFLNDETELRYAIDQLRAALSANRTELSAQGNETLDTQRQWEYNDALIEEIDRRFPKGRGSHNLWERMPYITSFCSHGDLLSMWRGYAHGPGFSIEFDSEILLDAFGEAPLQRGLTDEEHRRLRDLNHAVDAALLSVEYGREGAGAIIDALFDELGAQETIHSGTLAEHLLSRLMPDLARIKHPAFAEEQEVRLVVFRTGDHSPQPRLRAANGHLVPYYPLAFPHEAIRSIRVGPAVHRERSRLALEQRLGATPRGEYQHVRVDVSEAPLLY